MPSPRHSCSKVSPTFALAAITKLAAPGDSEAINPAEFDAAKAEALAA
jgi:hypothetical protein